MPFFVYSLVFAYVGYLRFVYDIRFIIYYVQEEKYVYSISFDDKTLFLQSTMPTCTYRLLVFIVSLQSMFSEPSK